ncbi:MAG: 3-phosphoshikimate 1-carboxyvinyltransferase [Planctomycetes bacterium]|nr:3-phosphoshikimate 1-carboxyvinyltransferase [Planctomycetota bacterium]
MSPCRVPSAERRASGARVYGGIGNLRIRIPRDVPTTGQPATSCDWDVRITQPGSRRIPTRGLTRYDAAVTRIRIEPAGPVNFDVAVPGSKSHTNRALVCASLAEGESVLAGASDSDDTARLVAVLAGIERLDADLVVRGGAPPRAGDYFFGNAGTSLRFFTSLAALGRGRFTIDGDARMRERPIGGLVDALRDLGVDARCGGRPPVILDARGIRGGRCTIRDDASSQFVSSILLAAPCADGPVTIEARHVPSWPYVQMTLDTMEAFGVRVEREIAALRVPKGAYAARRIEIEPDAAAANYFHAAAAVTGGRATVRGYRRGAGEGRFLDILESMKGRGVDVDMNDCPDSVQTLAVVALFAEGSTRIRNVKNLRVKETDRIAALGAELRKLGARVTEFEDGLEIAPGPLRPAEIETYNDHRMAMSFAVAALAVPGVEIRDPECVSKSFPRFFDVLESQGVKVVRVP